jgi:exodeoxyribonuclease VII small subunit
MGDETAGAPGDADVDAGRSFEDLVTELESVTEQLAGGQIGIEQAADLYEQAERLHRLARARLDAVQARVDALAARPPAGGAGGDG